MCVGGTFVGPWPPVFTLPFGKLTKLTVQFI